MSEQDQSRPDGLPAEYETLNDLQRFLARNHGLQFRFALRAGSYRAAIHVTGGVLGGGGRMLVVANDEESLDGAVNECLRRYEHDFPES